MDISVLGGGGQPHSIAFGVVFPDITEAIVLEYKNSRIYRVFFNWSPPSKQPVSNFRHLELF